MNGGRSAGLARYATRAEVKIFASEFPRSDVGRFAVWKFSRNNVGDIAHRVWIQYCKLAHAPSIPAFAKPAPVARSDLPSALSPESPP